MPLPLFVYGTLMSDQPRHDLLAAAVTRLRSAHVGGAALLDLGRYPMLVRGAGTVHGELCWLDERVCAEVLGRLDAYEGEMYERLAWAVHVDDGDEPIQAWLYAGAAAQAERFPAVESGSWRRHVAARAE